jgi:hypothetical protein
VHDTILVAPSALSVTAKGVRRQECSEQQWALLAAEVVPFLAESDKASTTGRGPATKTLNGSQPNWSGPSSPSAAGSMPMPRRPLATV